MCRTYKIQLWGDFSFCGSPSSPRPGGGMSCPVCASLRERHPGSGESRGLRAQQVYVQSLACQFQLDDRSGPSISLDFSFFPCEINVLTVVKALHKSQDIHQAPHRCGLTHACAAGGAWHSDTLR